MVGPADAHALQETLAAWGVEPQAVTSGRVFVDRIRATEANRPLSVGATVEVFPSTLDTSGKGVRILEERGGILAVEKPAGIPTIPDQRGSAGSLLGILAVRLGIGDPTRIHTSSRLDTDVSGVVLLALTPAARKALQEARDAGRYQRHYVAIASRQPQPPEGLVQAPIGRALDRRARKAGGSDAVASATRYVSIAQAGKAAVVAAEPVTGRTHQIRVHMAHLGAPLLGDALYGASRTVVLPSGAVRALGRIALHAAWVSVQFRAGKEPWTVSMGVPAELERLWRELGGDDGAWAKALRAIGG